MKSKSVKFAWKHVRVGKDDECWPWTLLLNRWGYGVCSLDGHTINASRAAYIVTFGELIGGFVVCHKCDNPACCNPAHLFAGTQAENLADCRAKGRSRGHFGKGADHPNHVAKLNPDRVREARALWASGISQSEIARRFGLDNQTIRRAVIRESWKHVA